jgi:hypothetical protein
MMMIPMMVMLAMMPFFCELDSADDFAAGVGDAEGLGSPVQFSWQDGRRQLDERGELEI